MYGMGPPMGMPGMPMLGLPGRGMGGGRGPFAPNQPPEKHDPSHHRSLSSHGYTVIRVLGTGNFGCVYLVRASNGREYAAKVMRADERNLKEIALLRQLSSTPHPNLVHYDTAWHEPSPKGPMAYLIMEFCPGGDLEKLKLPLPHAQAVSVILQICAGLSHLHARNITHRDVKEANVLVAADGTLRLTDFGISKQASHFDPSMTVVGTPPYMAPEILDGLTAGRARGAPYGPAVDKWSAGVLFYRLVSGKHPYASPAQALSRRPPAPLPPTVDRLVARLIMALLSHNPARRPDLRAVPAMLGVPPTAPPSTGGSPAPATTPAGAAAPPGGVASGDRAPLPPAHLVPLGGLQSGAGGGGGGAPPRAPGVPGGRRRANSSGGHAPAPTPGVPVHVTPSAGAVMGAGGGPFYAPRSGGVSPPPGSRGAGVRSPPSSPPPGAEGHVIGSLDGVVPPSYYPASRQQPQRPVSDGYGGGGPAFPSTTPAGNPYAAGPQVHDGGNPYAPRVASPRRPRSLSQPTEQVDGLQIPQSQKQCSKCFMIGHDSAHHPCSACGAIGHTSYECPRGAGGGGGGGGGPVHGVASAPHGHGGELFCTICSRTGHVAERHPCRVCGGYGHASAECNSGRW